MTQTACDDRGFGFPYNRKESQAVVKVKYVQLFSRNLNRLADCLRSLKTAYDYTETRPKSHYSIAVI